MQEWRCPQCTREDAFGMVAIICPDTWVKRVGTHAIFVPDRGPRAGQQLRGYLVRKGTRRAYKGSWLVFDCPLLWVALQKDQKIVVTMRY